MVWIQAQVTLTLDRLPWQDNEEGGKGVDRLVPLLHLLVAVAAMMVTILTVPPPLVTA